MRILIALLALMLGACATTDERSYRDYLQAQAAADARADAQLATISQQATACSDDTCRVAIAGFLALSRGAAGGQRSVAPPAPKAASGILGFTKDLAGLAVNAYLGNEGQRTTRALYSTFGSIVGSIADRPTVQVGGDYITGTQHIGDAIDVGADYVVGDGNATNGAQIGDRYGDDYTGRDRVDNSTAIDGDGNRIGSDDTIDNSDRSGGDGGECPGGEAEGGVCAGGSGGG